MRQFEPRKGRSFLAYISVAYCTDANAQNSTDALASASSAAFALAKPRLERSDAAIAPRRSPTKTGRAKAEGFKECLGRIHLFLHLRRVAVVQLPLLVPRKADALAICSRAALGPQTSRDASLPVGILELSLL